MREYRVWSNMRQRCVNPRHASYAAYGGRGIKVCDRWLTSYEAFLMDMGPRPSSEHSIDRIDNDGDYEPSNCRWATHRQQARNKRKTLYVEVEGVRRTVQDWAERTGRNAATIYTRLRSGWDPEEAVFLPYKACPTIRYGVPV